nr:HRDC domain-containing protein [Pleionea sp. CnH1-48]
MQKTEKLKSTDKLSWFKQDCQQLANRVEELDRFDNYYLNIKNAWRLKPLELQRLSSLAVWREQAARKHNLPRNFIVNDETLWVIARAKLDKSWSLPFIKSWHPVARRKYQNELLSFLKQQSGEDLELTETPLGPRFWQSITPQMQAAREKVVSIAESHQIEPDLLCSKKMMQGMVRFWLKKRFEPPRTWTCWREKMLTDAIKPIFVGES